MSGNEEKVIIEDGEDKETDWVQGRKHRPALKMEGNAADGNLKAAAGEMVSELSMGP